MVGFFHFLSHPSMENGISEPNGLKDMVGFFIKVLFKFANHHHTIFCTLRMEQPIVAILKACLPPYTWCTTLKSLWDIQ